MEVGMMEHLSLLTDTDLQDLATALKSERLAGPYSAVGVERLADSLPHPRGTGSRPFRGLGRCKYACAAVLIIVGGKDKNWLLVHGDRCGIVKEVEALC